MTHSWILKRIQTCARHGVLLDTNVLLLYLVGTFDQGTIESFKRTSMYTADDFRLLKSLVRQFHRIVTTPNVLTEINSLAGQLPVRIHGRFRLAFATEIASFDERYRESQLISRGEHFMSVGLTDAGILDLRHEKFLVLTDDLRFCALLERSGVTTLNFNNLRMAGWARET